MNSRRGLILGAMTRGWVIRVWSGGRIIVP